MADLITKVQSVESRGQDTVVKVDVTGPEVVPDFVKELRARGRALVASGPAGTTVDVVTDVAMGDIERFTKVRGQPVTKSTQPDVIPTRLGDTLNQMMETLQYTVVVNRHSGGEEEY